jgi:ATP-binding cassette subfamily B protein
MRELTNLATTGTGDVGAGVVRIGVLLLIATVVQALGTSAAGYLNHRAGYSYVYDLQVRLYAKVQQLSLRYFNDNKTGDIVDRVMHNTIAAESLIAHQIPDILLNVATVAGVIVLLFVINVKLALASLVAIPFILVVASIQKRVMFPLMDKRMALHGDMSGTVQENLSGIREIKVFNRLAHEEQKISGLADDFKKMNFKTTLVIETVRPALIFFATLGSVIIIIFGGYLVTLGEATIADIVAFVMYVGILYGPFKSAGGMLEGFGDVISSLKRVYTVIDEKPDIADEEDAASLGRAEGHIAFENLSFAYNPEIAVLEGIDFEIRPGQTIALVGATGAGKTTLASLLNRFFDPVAGSILIDGKDLRSVTLESLRDNISMVLQDTFLFSGSVYDNIAYGKKDATHDEVVAAAKTANAHEFILGLKDGYDTIVGERGVKLSGGQKQRVAIARAILRDTPILVLDESTSSLDTKTEREIQSALDAAAKGRTSLVIAHRLSTIQNADRILVLDGGSIVESGTHAELLSHGGVYATLHAMQKEDEKLGQGEGGAS